MTWLLCFYRRDAVFIRNGKPATAESRRRLRAGADSGWREFKSDDHCTSQLQPTAAVANDGSTRPRKSTSGCHRRANSTGERSRRPLVDAPSTSISWPEATFSIVYVGPCDAVAVARVVIVTTVVSVTAIGAVDYGAIRADDWHVDGPDEMLDNRVTSTT